MTVVGYYRKMMAASTSSSTQDTLQHAADYSELSIAIAIVFTSVAALCIVGILAFIVWRVWCMKHKIRQQS